MKRPRIAKKVADALWKRDQLEMRAANKLLSLMERRRRRVRSRRKR